jgi:hypothetical protein
MQEWGFLLDPCYFAVILEMRGLQLFLSRRSVAKIDTLLFNHHKHLGRGCHQRDQHGVHRRWYLVAKCLSLIDTLWWYEKEHANNASALLKQRGRQINFLASSLEREAVNEHD